MNITRMHILGQGTRVYQKGVMVPHVHEVSVPNSRSAQKADIWLVTNVMGVLETRQLVKNNDLDLQFTVIFTDRYGNQSILWSNEPQVEVAKAWETLGEGPLAMG